ncbi:MAG: archease [Candidatus Sungbacteria bacterium]|nr:archease [Candidatus Sungbacteria bacterium]
MQLKYDIFGKDGVTRVRVWGSSERELFGNALLGLAALLRPDVAPENRKTVRVRAHTHGKNLSDLLGEFLDNVIFENEMHNAVFSAMDIIHFSDKEIECELIGKHIDHVEEEIHAVALVGSGIQRTKLHHWEAEFVPEFV